MSFNIKLILAIFSILLTFTLINCEDDDVLEVACGDIQIIYLLSPRDNQYISGTATDISGGTVPSFKWKATAKPIVSVMLFDNEIEVDKETCAIQNPVDAFWEWNSAFDTESVEGSILYQNGVRIVDGERSSDELRVNLLSLLYDEESEDSDEVLQLYCIVIARDSNGVISRISNPVGFYLKEISPDS